MRYDIPRITGHAEVVKLLVKAQAIVDKANQKGTTALMRATQEGNEEVVRILVEAGADVSKRNNERMNALMLGSQVRMLDTHTLFTFSYGLADQCEYTVIYRAFKSHSNVRSGT